MSSLAGDLPFELVTVQSGAASLRSRVFGETFHPVIGPMAEAAALHVNQQRLVERAAEADQFVVWDVGLGAAANALCAIGALNESPAAVELVSFERDLGALRFAVSRAAELPYLAEWSAAIATLLDSGSVQVGSVHWRLELGDFREWIRAPHGEAPQAVLFDPYSPASNPEMWTLEAFRELRQALSPERPCLLSNYTRSTAIRAALLLAGWHVGHGQGVGEKEETTVASNVLELIERPLDAVWLGRAGRSTRSAPPRDGAFQGGPISAEDLARLRACPQFA